MVTIKVQPGNCNLESDLQFESDAKRNVTVTGTSQCKYVQQLIEGLEPINGLKESLGKYSDSTVLQQAEGTLAHTTCPVPLAIMKGIEISCGLALPQDVKIDIKKDKS